MKAKRILSLALAAILAVSALSGCDWLWWLEQQQAASSSGSSSSSAPAPATAAVTMMKITTTVRPAQPLLRSP